MHADKAAHYNGAVACIYRFGSRMNELLHFRMRVVDGVFEEMLGDVDRDGKPAPPSIIFYQAGAIDERAVAQARAALRRPILRAFVGRGLLEGFEAKEMLPIGTGGFLWTPVYASKRTTALASSDYYATQRSELGNDRRTDQRGA
jgi:hypothetical protein